MRIGSMDILNKKLADSKAFVREAYEKYDVDKMAVAWTGGKDSTLLLWIIRQVCEETGWSQPKCFTIDEGDMFDEVRGFIARIMKEWEVSVEFLHNIDVSRAAGNRLGAPVKVRGLNSRNQREVERLGYEESEFPYEPESFVGNHLMKTVVLNEYLERNRIQAFFEGIRWDEQESRSNEVYFSPRAATEYSPAHMRIFPILHFLEREVWEMHFAHDIPICPLYQQGYRSLGARVTTKKHSDLPAWEQDLESTTERGGRRQDKEHLMKRLRELGYM